MSREKYDDLPVPELLRRADEWIKAGGIVFFKFTCEKCGSRQTFAVPNTFYARGKCEECGHITEIKKGGFLALMGWMGIEKA